MRAVVEQEILVKLRLVLAAQGAAVRAVLLARARLEQQTLAAAAAVVMVGRPLRAAQVAQA
jgi:hypothetical protein